MVSLVFFDILQQPYTVISNSKQLTHPNVHWTVTFLSKHRNCSCIKYKLNNCMYNTYCEILYTCTAIWYSKS